MSGRTGEGVAAGQGLERRGGKVPKAAALSRALKRRPQTERNLQNGPSLLRSA